MPHQWFGLKLTLLLDTSRYRSDGAMSQGLYNLCLDQPDSTGMAVEEPNRGEASESRLYACFNSVYEHGWWAFVSRGEQSGDRDVAKMLEVQHQGGLL